MDKQTAPGASLGTLWQARFPLLLHYLDQGEGDPAQWQSWLADLATDSARQIEMEDWTLGLSQALVAQLSLYPSESSEKGGQKSSKAKGKFICLFVSIQ